MNVRVRACACVHAGEDTANFREIKPKWTAAKNDRIGTNAVGKNVRSKHALIACRNDRIKPTRINGPACIQAGVTAHDFFELLTPAWNSRFTLPVNLLAWITTIGGDASSLQVRFTCRVHWASLARKDARSAQSAKAGAHLSPEHRQSILDHSHRSSLSSPTRENQLTLDCNVGAASADDEVKAAKFASRIKAVDALSAHVHNDPDGVGGEAHEAEFRRLAHATKKLADCETNVSIGTSAIAGELVT